MNIGMLLPFIILIGAMFLMTRSAKNKQRQAAEMRNQMEPGSGVRTIGGMYAVVKEVHDDTVLLELADGVHAHFAKNAVGAVLDEAEYDRIVHGIEPEAEDDDEDVDGLSLAKTDESPADDEDRLDPGKSLDKDTAEAEDAAAKDEQLAHGPKTDGTDSK